MSRKMAAFRLPEETRAQIRWLGKMMGKTATEVVIEAVRSLWERETRETRARLEPKGRRYAILAGKDKRWLEIGWVSREVTEGAEKQVLREMEPDLLMTALLLLHASRRKGTIRIHEPAFSPLALTLWKESL